MSNIDDLISLVRTTTSLDTESDLPTSLIRTYIKDGYEKIINTERRWPFFETIYTISTTTNQRSYPLSAIGSGDLREVTSVVDTSVAGNRLSLIPMEEAERIWNGAMDVAMRPMYYLVWGYELKLYPKPSTVYPLSIRGYRKPSYTWVNDSSTQIDCDDRLHTALAYYAISQVYRRQEDPEMARDYMSLYNENVQVASKDIMRVPSQRPMIMAGGHIGPSYNYWLYQLGWTLGK